MIGLLLILTSLVFSALWLFLLFGNRNAKIFGLRYETLMFISIASAVLGTLFLRIGI